LQLAVEDALKNHCWQKLLILQEECVSSSEQQIFVFFWKTL
jgi:hypothetical protein